MWVGKSLGELTQPQSLKGSSSSSQLSLFLFYSFPKNTTEEIKQKQTQVENGFVSSQPLARAGDVLVASAWRGGKPQTLSHQSWSRICSGSSSWKLRSLCTTNVVESGPGPAARRSQGVMSGLDFQIQTQKEKQLQFYHFSGNSSSLFVRFLGLHQ